MVDIPYIIKYPLYAIHVHANVSSLPLKIIYNLKLHRVFLFLMRFLEVVLENSFSSYQFSEGYTQAAYY